MSNGEGSLGFKIIALPHVCHLLGTARPGRGLEKVATSLCFHPTPLVKRAKCAFPLAILHTYKAQVQVLGTCGGLTFSSHTLLGSVGHSGAQYLQTSLHLMAQSMVPALALFPGRFLRDVAHRLEEEA